MVYGSHTVVFGWTLVWGKVSIDTHALPPLNSPLRIRCFNETFGQREYGRDLSLS